MAIYHLTAKVVSRGKGQSAIAAAAYRSGEKLTDEQTGEEKHYRARSERIGFTGIFAPTNAPDWVHSRNELWNNVERFEKRKDAQLAREIEVSLPHEMTEQQREWLVKDFVREQFVRRGYAVDVAIHGPDADSDQRNHHAHLMVTMRTIGPDGFAPTKDRSLNTPEQLVAWREEWARLTNRHLERHGHAARIDHRSLEDQGIAREPTIHIGPAAQAMTERGRDFASEPITVPKDFRRHEERVIDYPAIDGGQSRMGHNQAIILRNQARPLSLREHMELAEQETIERQRREFERQREEKQEKENKPRRRRDKADDRRMPWTDRAGMEAQQESALENTPLGIAEREKQRAEKKERVQTERQKQRAEAYYQVRQKSEPDATPDREQQAREAQAQAQRRRQEEEREQASKPATIENAPRENTDQQQSRLGSDKAREQSDRVKALADWMKQRAAARGRERGDDGGREM